MAVVEVERRCSAVLPGNQHCDEPSVWETGFCEAHLDRFQGFMDMYLRAALDVWGKHYGRKV